MIQMTRQVMELLDKLKEEKTKDNPSDNQTLNKSIESSLTSASTVSEVLQSTNTLNNKFKYPIELYNPPKRSSSKKISYQVSKEKYEAVQQRLDANSPREIGLETFDYFFDNEV